MLDRLEKLELRNAKLKQHLNASRDAQSSYALPPKPAPMYQPQFQPGMFPFGAGFNMNQNDPYDYEKEKKEREKRKEEKRQRKKDKKVTYLILKSS